MNLVSYGSMFDIGWMMGIADIRSCHSHRHARQQYRARRIGGRRA